MKIRIAASVTLPLFLAFAALAIAPRAQAQSIAAPPVSSGLWQSESTMVMSGPNMPRMSRTTVSQSCMAPDTWKKFGSGKSSHKDLNCKTTTFHQDAHGLTYEMQCGQPNHSVSDIRADFLFDGPQHVHGTIVIKISEPSMPNGMTMNTKVDAHYVSASCGTMKPGDVKMLKH